MDDLQDIELDAAADFWAAAPAAVHGALALEQRDLGCARCFVATGLQPTLMFRRALLRRAPAAAELDALVRHMSARASSWALGCAAAQRSPALEEALVARGFQPAYAWMKFRHAGSAPAPPACALPVRELGAGDGAAFAAVVARTYGLDGAALDWLAALPGRSRWTCLAVCDNGRPVATGVVYVDGDHAWLGFAATLPEARRRGAQGALLALRIEAARGRGAHVIVTETGENVAGKPSDSYRNIQRAGFVEAGLRAHWLAPR